MQHPALIQALAAAHMEDLQRAAARSHTIRLASMSRRRPLGAAVGIDRASRDARRAASLTPEEAPMSTRVPSPDPRPRHWLHPRPRSRARLAPDRQDLGALAGELDRCCTSIPTGRAGDHGERHRRDSSIRRS